jgi:magnesium transporter
MPRARCYHDGVLVAEDFPLSAIARYLAQPGAVVWVHLPSPRSTDLGLIAEQLGLHALALEDATTSERQRPKLDRYIDHLFLSAYLVQFDSDTAELATCELAAFLTRNAFITVSKSGELDLTAVVARWDASTLANDGTCFLLHGLLDHLADGYTEAARSLDEEVDDLQNELFLPGAGQEGIQLRTFMLRKALVQLRHVVVPMQGVLTAIERNDLNLLSAEIVPYLRDVHDHVIQTVGWTDALRELVTGILETTITLQGNRLNIVSKKVTGYAAMIAVPTAVTGFYGQNVPYPGFGQSSGLYASIALIVALSGVLYLLFKSQDWL